MKEEEILSQGSFWLVVIGSLLLGVEGLGMLAEKQLNPLLMIPGNIGDSITTGAYLLIGLAGLHQTYFGYSSLMKDFETPS